MIKKNFALYTAKVWCKFFKSPYSLGFLSYARWGPVQCVFVFFFGYFQQVFRWRLYHRWRRWCGKSETEDFVFSLRFFFSSFFAYLYISNKRSNMRIWEYEKFDIYEEKIKEKISFLWWLSHIIRIFFDFRNSLIGW